MSVKRRELVKYLQQNGFSLLIHAAVLLHQLMVVFVDVLEKQRGK